MMIVERTSCDVGCLDDAAGNDSIASTALAGAVTSAASHAAHSTGRKTGHSKATAAAV